MPTFNWTSIRETVAKSAGAKIAAFALAKEIVDDAKAEMLEDFDNHDVTQEIQEGPSASNISNTLGGYGNLFSFIGFYDGDKPIEEIRRILKERTFIQKSALGASFVKGGGISFSFKVFFPTFEDFEEVGAYPDDWSAGNWIKDIEKRGIKGLSHYLYDENFGIYEQSRSGTGLQAKTRDGKLITIRGDKLSSPIQFISEILENFKRRIV